MSRLSPLALAAVLLASPLAAQQSSHSYQWYWGVQGGAFGYKTNVQSLHFDPIIGGHWLITGKRTALYLSYEQAFFSTAAVAEITDANSSTGLRNASFSNVRRLSIGVMALPIDGHIQPLIGGGFSIVQILNPSIDCSGATANAVCASASDSSIAAQAASDQSSKAFAWAMAGVQINFGRLGLFGQATVTSSAQQFMLDGPTFTVQGGIRYSLGSSKEDITDQNN
ncbi:MAG TPA: hypothetical protein VMC86_02965 [Gemmatimonadales bacterium]|nr:hypothetical protein [Gemmatimonadales bacterium]